MDHYAKNPDSPAVSKKLKKKIGGDDEEDGDYSYMEDYGSDDDDNLYDMVDEDDNIIFEENDKSTELDEYALLQAQFDKADLPAGVELSLPMLIKAPVSKNTLDNITNKQNGNLFEIIKFQNFYVVDSFKDHHYNKKGTSNKKFPKEWSKEIQKEWKSLTTNLPETIYVRVAEDRMDLLRAAIVGPPGTPYHDGLFFFDCQFPQEYPNKPPLVHYHSGGLRLNPNLYHSGKVCLSLLGTWHGQNSENWIAGKSTMLQVLVSIQGLILNEKPYFNEPGLEKMSRSKLGDSQSNIYSEKTFILSLRTMVYTLRKPPEHFNDLVSSHFRVRGRDILNACKAYTNGALVASDIKDLKSYKECSKKCSSEFMKDVNGLINMLVACFSRIGTPHCDEFRVDPNVTLEPHKTLETKRKSFEQKKKKRKR